MHTSSVSLYESYRLRDYVHYSPANPQRVPPDQFFHRRELGDPTRRTMTAPNNDTLYSHRFLDLSGGALVLEVPEIADRYYSFAFMDFYTNNFAYIGPRTTGSGARKFVIAGPAWNGSLPAGTRLIKSPTTAVWLLARFLVVDASDLPRVHHLQDAVKLYSLTGSTAPEFRGPTIRPNDPWNYFVVVNHALTQNPPPSRDATMMARIATIGLGPGRQFDPTRFNAAQQNALRAGIEEAKRFIAAKELSDKVVNGWGYPPKAMGNFGDDYLLRAATALSLIGVLEPAEATYLSYVGEPLDGSQTYRLHFDRGQLPPVNAFWSLSIYEVMPDKRLFFAENPIGRYAIGDRTPGLQRSHDGSLDLYIQHASPSAAHESNWLPAPRGPFALILRAYMPGSQLIDRTYAPPRIERQP